LEHEVISRGARLFNDVRKSVEVLSCPYKATALSFFSVFVEFVIRRKSCGKALN